MNLKPKKRSLSPEMKKAWAVAQKYGKLVRYRGGYWAQEGSPMKPRSFLEPDYLVPQENFGTATVEALASRGLIEATYIRNLPSGMLITEYSLTKSAANESANKDTEKA